MKIYIVHGDIQGTIGVADSYESAVQFLIEAEWITEKHKIWDYDEEKENSLHDLGVNLEEIKTWGIDKFNDFFYGDFCIQAADLITNGHNRI